MKMGRSLKINDEISTLRERRIRFLDGFQSIAERLRANSYLSGAIIGRRKRRKLSVSRNNEHRGENAALFLGIFAVSVETKVEMNE